MADRKISDLTALTAPASGDFLPIVDISEAAAASKNKRITIEELMRGVPDGTAAAPGIAFETDPNTGIFSPGADQLAISTGGTARLTSSTTALTSALPVDVPLGAAATPSLTFTGDLNTGIYSPGADQVAVATNGQGRLFIDASGNVGVGLTPASYAGYSVIGHGSTTGATLEQKVNGILVGSLTTDSQVTLKANTAIPIVFGTNNIERLRITSAGLVGIGTSIPVFLTDILSGTANTGANVNNPSQLSITGPNKTLTGGGATVFVNSNSDLAIDTGGSIALSGRNTTSSTNSVVWGVVKGAKENATSANTAGYLAFASQNHNAGALVEAMRIDSQQRVGIGSTSPLSPLVVSNGSNKNIEFQPGSTCYLLAYDRTASDYLDLDITAENLIFSTNNGTERARIDSSGRLLVGTSTSRAVTAGTSGNWEPRLQVTKTGIDAANIAAYSFSTYAVDLGGGLRHWPGYCACPLE
jgi:hypothetical protein